MKHEAVIIDFVRTPLCGMGGSLSSLQVHDLAKAAMLRLLERTMLDPSEVDQVIFGHAHMDTFPYNLARYSWLLGGLPADIPAYTINQCGISGIAAISRACNLIRTGNDLTVISGGAESYSQAPYVMRNARYSVDFSRSPVTDSITEGELSTQTEPLNPRITSDIVAQELGISRQELDEEIAAHVQRSLNLWDERIAALSWEDRKKGTITVSKDESILLSDIQLIKAAPPFDGCSTVTPLNYGHYADGAAAMLLMSDCQAKQQGLQPIARVDACVFSGCDPHRRWIGAVDSLKRLLSKHAVEAFELSDVEIISDSAATYCAIANEAVKQGISRAALNPTGSNLVDGINEGADGLLATGAAVLNLRRTGNRYSVIVASAAGGQGASMLVELL